MDMREVVMKAQDAMRAERVFGDPVERDGVVLVPAAEVSGGGGGGGGSEEGGSSGSGGGYGLRARPVGAWVISDGDVRWMPVFDVSNLAARALLAFGLLLIARRLLAEPLRSLRRREPAGSQ